MNWWGFERSVWWRVSPLLKFGWQEALIDDLPASYLQKLIEEIKCWTSAEKEKFLAMVGESKVKTKKEYFDLKVKTYSPTLEEKILVLGEAYKEKLYTLLEKLAKKFSTKENDFIIERLWMMEDSVLKSNLDFQDRFINNFKFGKYPMLLEESPFWKMITLKYDSESWKFKYVSRNSLKSFKWEFRDYIIKKDNNWNYIILFWESHPYLANSENVVYAWEIWFDKNSKLIKINNNSWHYKPDWNDEVGKKAVIETFKEKFWIDVSDKLVEYIFIN